MSTQEETFTEKCIEPLQTERSAKLETLLKELQKVDVLFERNVPVQYREQYDDEKLLEHLRTTYVKTEFVVREEKEVERYIEPLDKIVAKKTITDLDLILKAYEPFTVKKLDKNTNKGILIRGTGQTEKENNNPEINNVDVSTGIIIGVNPNWSDTRLYFSDGRVLTTHELIQSTISKVKSGQRMGRKMDKRDIIVFPKDLDLRTYNIPEGSVGVVLGIKKEKEKIDRINALFLPRENLFMKMKESRILFINDEWGGNHFYTPNVPLTCEDIILIKQNKIKFDELYKSIYVEERDGIVKRE